MDITAKKIITETNKKFPQQQHVEIRNLSDLEIDAKLGENYQYIIGVTRAFEFGGVISIDNYKHKMAQVIGRASLNFDCVGWPFRGYELEEAISVLKELSEYYNANLDIDKMIGRLNMKKDDDNFYYIVMTVVIIPNFRFE